MKKAIRLIVAAALAIAPASAWAQITSPTYYGEPHVYDLREFTANLNWQPAQVNSRIRTSNRTGSPAPDDIRWIDRIYNLPDYMRNFYDNHGLRVQEVLNGGSNYLSSPANDNTYAIHSQNGSTYVILKEIKKSLQYSYPQDVINDNPNALQDYAVAAVQQDLSEHEDEYLEDVYAFIPYMFLSMSYDYPQAFWLGNYWTWTASWSCSFGVDMNAGKDSVKYTYKVLFTVKDSEFDYRIDDYRTERAIREGIEEYNELVEDILKDVPNTTRYAQVKYLNEWLTKHNAYCSTYDPQNSPQIVWSPMSALRGTAGSEGPVCEGYARAFKVLCDKINIPCILAVGDAKSSKDDEPESHMWNEVKMNDGNWYAVDVTWNDPVTGSQSKVSGAESEKWLLLGKNDIVNNSDNLTFAQSHPNSLIYGQAQSSAWDYDNESLIADTHFDIANGVEQPKMQDEAVTVHSISGLFIGKFDSMDDALNSIESGIYIINNRKVLVK